MDLKLIDRAIADYAESIDEKDKARLDFFRRLWQVQYDCSCELIDAEYSYHLPTSQDLNAAYRAYQPIFEIAPVEVDKDALVCALDRLVGVVCDSKFFPNEINECFDRVNWQRVLDASKLALAGKCPGDWLEDLSQVLFDDGMTEQAAHLGTLIASMALRIQLEEPSRAVMGALKDVNKAGVLNPMLCPVCGSAPMMAHVGGETSSEGRGKLLVCSQCGAQWEFERVRCVCCGTQNQGHLHFFNIEGDDAHRIATCDECGGYMRTLYSDDILSFCSYEVEDVVMARLDAVAQNPQLAGGMKKGGDAT